MTRKRFIRSVRILSPEEMEEIVEKHKYKPSYGDRKFAAWMRRDLAHWIQEVCADLALDADSSERLMTYVEEKITPAYLARAHWDSLTTKDYDA